MTGSEASQVMPVVSDCPSLVPPASSLFLTLAFYILHA